MDYTFAFTVSPFDLLTNITKAIYMRPLDGRSAF